MEVARTLSIALAGLEGTLVEIEADVSPGLPVFSLVGLPDSSTLQSRDRVRAAAAQIGASLAQRRITVNMSPAWIAKSGSGFDLGIAVAVLAAQGVIPAAAIAPVLHLGELSLDGLLRPVPGILPALLAARAAGVRTVVVPDSNAAEAQLVDGIRVIAAPDLAAVLRAHGARIPLTPPRPAQAPAADAPTPAAEPPSPPDFRDVIGQHQARFAAEVAAAGGHHLLLQGPPGAGKTMIASRLPGILPQLEAEDALAVSAIRSLSGRFDARGGLIRTPPFESPHHTATASAMVGGGSGIARPGAISRAHAGVLFLDEAPEFDRAVLEALREPLETGDVTLHRAKGVARYPARFQLVLAANPCPCGKGWGSGKDCSCTPMQRRRYVSRLSGPVLDRIDMRLQVPPSAVQSGSAEGAECSASIAERVRTARARQQERFAAHPWSLNSQIPGPQLRGRFAPEPQAARLLEHALGRGRLTLRGHDRVMRLAWTLADLSGSPRPTADHVGRTLTLRGEDQR